MEALKNFITLSQKIEIYVPSTINVNTEIDNSEYVKKTAILLANCFGGASSELLLGYWMSDKCGLVTEKTTKVYANCNSEDLEKHIEEIVQWCYTMKEELSQESIAITVNNVMHFIY